MEGWKKVENSNEAALGGGILSSIIEHDTGGWVVGVYCEDQVGDEVEMIVEMRGKPHNVFLRLVVTEVERVLKKVSDA